MAVAPSCGFGSRLWRATEPVRCEGRERARGPRWALRGCLAVVSVIAAGAIARAAPGKGTADARGRAWPCWRRCGRRAGCAGGGVDGGGNRRSEIAIELL